jgi:phage terminase large subunit-like protein
MAAYPHVNDANKYARDVVAGRIVACRNVKLACERHLDELERQRDPTFPYRFDKDKAERVCRFIEKLPHTKGKWRKAKKRLTLEPWQKFLFCCVFGWLRKKTGFRRFREVYVKVARKNGKSAIAAGIGNYCFVADDESGAEVYCGATTEKQAWEVFRPAKIMAEILPAMRARFGIEVHAKKLTLKDGSVFEPVIGKPGDGSSPHVAIIDEYHEHDTSDQYDTFDTGMGSREQPMIVVITTSGYNIDSPCFDLEQRCVAMLNGAKDDALFALMYSLDDGDDWTDPAMLIKANPNIGVSVDTDYLLAQQQKAIAQAGQANKFKVKHCNLWTSAKSAYFNMENWKACEDKNLKVEHFRGKDGTYGADLARKLDMNAGIPLYWREIKGKVHWYCVGAHFWMPFEQVYNNENKSLGDKFIRYVEEGYLSVTDGAEIDYREIETDIRARHLITPFRRIPIDPHGATNLAHHLIDAGLDVVTIEQNFKNLSDPMKELEAAITTGRFHHDGNPILAWHISNIVGKHYPGNDDVVKPVKQKNINKIDGGVALIMAMGEAMLLRNNPTNTTKSVYETSEVGC